MNDPHIAADLRRWSGAWTSSAPSDLVRLSTDFGGLTHKWPAVVVRPSSAMQVAGVFHYASRHGSTVTLRGAGHSLGGQTLTEGGIILDAKLMSHVSTPNVDDVYLDVAPGADWASVVHTTISLGLVPPVLTGALGTSVGGTHSVGGIGYASHLHGIQANHCIGLEVVTPNGEVHWCDANTESELFRHVLCGLGQFGVVTQVRHRLRRFRPFTRRWHFFYTHLRDMLRDLEVLADSRGPSYLAGYGASIDARVGYSIGAAFEADDEHPDKAEAVLSSITPRFARGPTVERFHTYMKQPPLSDARGSAHAAARGVINPWIDLLLPAAQVRPVLEEVLRCFPPRLLRGATMRFWPLFRSQITRPLFMIPDAERIIMAGVYMTAPDTERSAAMSALTDATERLMAAGGKRYPYAWLPFDSSGWARHFGARWPDVCRLKRQYDPQMRLNRGIIQYGAETLAPSHAEVS